MFQKENNLEENNVLLMYHKKMLSGWWIPGSYLQSELLSASLEKQPRTARNNNKAHSVIQVKTVPNNTCDHRKII